MFCFILTLLQKCVQNCFLGKSFQVTSTSCSGLGQDWEEVGRPSGLGSGTCGAPSSAWNVLSPWHEPVSLQMVILCPRRPPPKVFFCPLLPVCLFHLSRRDLGSSSDFATDCPERAWTEDLHPGGPGSDPSPARVGRGPRAGAGPPRACLPPVPAD